jgi:hypothetical protein
LQQIRAQRAKVRNQPKKQKKRAANTTATAGIVLPQPSGMKEDVLYQNPATSAEAYKAARTYEFAYSNSTTFAIAFALIFFFLLSRKSH